MTWQRPGAAAFFFGKKIHWNELNLLEYHGISWNIMKIHESETVTNQLIGYLQPLFAVALFAHAKFPWVIAMIHTPVPVRGGSMGSMGNLRSSGASPQAQASGWMPILALATEKRPGRCDWHQPGGW